MIDLKPELCGSLEAPEAKFTFLVSKPTGAVEWEFTEIVLLHYKNTDRFRVAPVAKEPDL